MQAETRQKSSGFTLMELIIAIFIMSVLAAVAIPSYLHYVKKAYYSEIVQTADRYSLAVSACLRENQGDKTKCDAGENGVPPDINLGVGQVSSVSVVNGVITVIPKTINGITDKDTYVLTPTYKKDGFYWIASGGGCRGDLAPDC